MLKIGIGYDIHRFARRRKLIIGGVEVPYKKGLLGHSDADVLIHAVCDALLGALGESDIGVLFPDTDPKYRNISSLELLKKVRGILEKKGFHASNVDSVVVLEKPKLGRLKEEMKSKIAKALKIAPSQVSVKATTQESVGDIGRGKAACAHAVVLIEKSR